MTSPASIPTGPVIDGIDVRLPRRAPKRGTATRTRSARRVAPVIDAWFDSGSMPAAQVGYPNAPGSGEAFAFPADFISEAIDQTRGWFYSLLAVNTLVFGETPYQHVVCLGHIVDADGRKMSKSLGNIIDPWTILDTRGADPLRWWMFSQGSPWTPTRASLAAIDTATARHAAEAVEHLQLLHHLRLAERLRPGRPRRPAAGLPECARPLGPLAAGQHRCHGDHGAGGLRAPRCRLRPGRPGRRPVQLVRAPQPAALLAHRSRRPGRGHPRRAGHVARRPDPRSPCCWPRSARSWPTPCGMR